MYVRLNRLLTLRTASLAIIFIATLVAYSNSFSGSFVFDDVRQTIENPNMKSLGSIPNFFTRADLGTDIKQYRPVLQTSFALNYAVSRYRVGGYHIFNLSVHLLCALLLFLIVELVMKDTGRYSLAVCLVIALIFAIHPVNTNGVTYISGRSTMLASVFLLAGFYSFLVYRSMGGSVWAVIAVASYATGLLSKENAVVLPFLVILYDILMAPEGRVRSTLMSRKYHYTAYFIVLGLYLAAKWRIQGNFNCNMEKYPNGVYPVSDYLLSEAHSLLVYLRLMFLPTNLNVDYEKSLTNALDARAAVGVMLLCAMIYLIYRLRRVMPEVSFFGLWFLIALAPESSFFPLPDLIVEYRLYLPSAGFIASAVMLASRYVSDRRVVVVCAVFSVLAFSLLTYSRNNVWATESSLWSDAVKKSPRSDRAHYNLGVALTKLEKYREAVSEYETGLALKKTDVGYNGLGFCQWKLGMREQAARQFTNAITLNPTNIFPYVNLGKLYIEMGEFEKSRDILNQAVSLKPDSASAHHQLKVLYSRTGDKAAEARESELAQRYGTR